MTLSEELQWRGFVNQTTFPDLSALDKEPITFYWGVDPSASSMTIGNLAAAMMVRHFIDHGHKAILLVGGATGMIGDPDGKKDERNLLTLEDIAKNKASIAEQYKTVFANPELTIVDNYDWFKDFNYLEFLRTVGKHVPMSTMLGRDFIQSRLGEGGSGISYAEFSYSLIQGYDFLHLFQEMGVTLQVCGADQWGNSIAGVDLIRRIAGGEAHVYSTPLIVNKATGVKFGKSEDGAVWLDPEMTSVYKFYQFWLNVDDEGVGDYLKIYTLLNKEEHEKIMVEFEHDRAGRLAQKTLAYEVTKLVHGQAAADSVVRVTNSLFGSGEYSQLTTDDFAQLKHELPTPQVKLGDGLINALVQSGLANTNSEARRFLEQGAVYVNGKQVSLDKVIIPEDRIDGYHAILRRGKNTNAVLQISE
jgi:tyrosyl-tRNA synthetase